jgi:Ca-activated chloride channel family protein
LRAHVEPGSVSVRSIEFFVDGVAACRATGEPFECDFDAGPRAQARKIVVVAVLGDGRRLTASRDTLAIALSETIDTAAVNVPVLVLTSSGQPLLNLTAADFEVLDEGKPQTITFANSENPQSQVAIAIDRSQSMKGTMDEVKTAVAQFMDRFAPPDVVTLAAFNHEFNVLALRESNPARRRTALGSVRPLGGTALYDAIYRSLSSFSDDLALKTVVMVSDGEDSHSKVVVEALAEKIRGTDAVVYVLMRRSGTGSREARRRLERFIHISGGRWVEIEDQRDLQEALAAIAVSIKQQYLLGFTPDQPATGPRRLTVRVKGRNVQVIARTEYGPRVK